MKKRICSLACLFFFVFVLSSCGTPQSDANVESEKPLTGNVFIDSEIETSHYFMALSELNQSARIQISKSDALAAGMDAFVEFAREVVEGSNYSWFTVCFGDGTGVIFLGSSMYNVGYGKYSREDWSMVEEYGFLYFDENSATYDYRSLD